MAKKKSGKIAVGKWTHLGVTVGWRILLEYFTWMRRYGKHPEKYPLEKRYGKLHKLAYRLTKHNRIDLRVTGFEYLNAPGPKVIVANHLSINDVVTILAISKKPITFLAKKEVYDMPFVGHCLRAIDGFFLDREDPRQGVKVLSAASNYLLAHDATIIVYPEGTRQKEPFSPELLPFHAGSFKLVDWGKASLVRMAEFGTFRPLNKSDGGRAMPVEMTFFPPESYEEASKKSTQELAEESRAIIESEVHKMQEYDKAFYASGKNKQKRPAWWKDYD